MRPWRGQHERGWKCRSLRGSPKSLSVKDFPRANVSEAAGCRRAQGNTAGGGADVAGTHLGVNKETAPSAEKLEHFEEQLVRNVKCTAQWQVHSARLQG